MSSIGRVFERQSSSGFSVISPTGGIRPADRKRSTKALYFAECEEISRGLSAKHSLRAITLKLGRAPSTICREVRRNLACYPDLSAAVPTKLRRKWSPEQIAGWLKRSFLKEPHKQVSHETIYKSLYIQARGILKKELLEHLRAKRTVRRSKHASLKRKGLGQIKDLVPISERPSSVEDRAILGHWEVRSEWRLKEQLYRDAR